MGRTVEGAGVGGFRPRLPGLLGIATLLAGCGGRTPGPPPAPEPLTAPGVEVSQALPPDPGAGELPPFFRLEDPDPILDSPRAWDPEILDDVQWWIDLFTDRGAGTFASWLEQMGRWEGLVDEEIARRGLPPSLRYLPMIESGYRPAVRSRAGAVGMWQIMGPTARSFGMEVTRLLDERRDPLVSTPLALDYLSELNERFGSWFLALAAYNGGPGRVESLLRRHALGARGDDSLFLVIREHLPGETRRFVPKLLAAARIARSPDRYGFAEVEALSPTAFDVVTVPDATSLDVLAGAAEVSQSVVEEMNPHILRGVTPTGRPVGVRVPAGQGAIFERNYARIPPGERVTFLEHRVAPGETLSHIARRFGVRVADLRAANPGVEPRRLQIGDRVVVPRTPGSGVGTAPFYTVQRGDTLSDIAARHGLRAGDLARANGLSLDSVIRPGDRVLIPDRGR